MNSTGVYIRSFSIQTEKRHPFPFNVPAVKFAQQVLTDSPVTILIGDNGCGKSTLLETLALKLGLPLIGGHIDINGDPSFEAASLLQSSFKLEWSQQTAKGFFFRAEDFSDFIYQVQNQQNRLGAEFGELKDSLGEARFQEFIGNMNYPMNKIKQEYGDNMYAYSHGEAYIKILSVRVNGKGVYILDEPEAALSPIKQMALIGIILDTLKQHKAQFIIATHSPIVMGIPGACIYEIQESGIEKLAFRETEHYRVTRAFLENPEQYLRYLQ
jgi:predicted ATPase